ncbi:hypothetical protein GT360_06350 [Vibrio astriarenae]|uniref:Dinitrogenase iron-molybdenum cofactor biosynthesis domain-containing protein n=1 Tax=Vibrio astriarenae TaxID=1481923 RepID=A0A7Z2T2I1_9VIBR|nr:NifB/NifX family molybdenum-iron cluster-binding protein [Vibrio astriarenae]QIA63156.1 hypothetical protein GT360_06350 [Vibrio astriarenae]
MWERKLHIANTDDHFKPIVLVAFATKDRHCVDQHFGQARTFLVYGVSKEEYRLMDAIDFTDHGMTKQKLTDKTQALSHCHAVFCNACGTSALKQLLNLKTYPVKVDVGTEINTCLYKIQFEINHPKESWLQRALIEAKHGQFDREAYLDALLEEPWDY